MGFKILQRQTLPNIEKNPMFQRLGRYPTSVRVFRDPILFLAGLQPLWEHGQQRHVIIVEGKEMAFRNFIYAENEENSSCLPNEPSHGLGNGSLSISENTDPFSVDAEPSLKLTEDTVDSGGSSKPEVFVVHPGRVAARIKDRKCKTKGGRGGRPGLPLRENLHLGLRPLVLLVLKFLPPRMIIRFLHFLMMMKQRERAREEECEELRSKCKAAMTDFEKNPTVVAMREKMSTLSIEAKEHKANLDRMLLESQKWACYHVSLLALELKVASLKAVKARLEVVEASLNKEVDDVKRDKIEVVLKVVPYAALELIHSDELGRLVGKLVSSDILYKRCDAFEQVAVIKEPFDLLKLKGYRPSYKKGHTQAGNELATATFPWLPEFVADPSSPIEVLLSKKPPALQRHVPLKTQVLVPSSQRATLSSTPASNLMSHPAAVSSVQP
nr:hypothetical protein [Tanacetum cinerariifolium]